MASSFPYCHVNRLCLWKKTQIEKKEYTLKPKLPETNKYIFMVTQS